MGKYVHVRPFKTLMVDNFLIKFVILKCFDSAEGCVKNILRKRKYIASFDGKQINKKYKTTDINFLDFQIPLFENANFC